MSNAPFKAFADDSAVITAGDLQIENGTDAVVLHGQLEIRRDKAGLASARILAQALADAVRVLEATPDLPDRAAPEIDPRGSVANPFGG